ncbi:unnamed protein product [Brassicogethes aeneus]|uniref:Uncharacterized protein n=1 Tax=Brassicogethes aeneus TaxID=1431903 RepID=A0A9P0B6Z2_BRAAE|nr:unnamed protein product [Brassicogethes aeneus]
MVCTAARASSPQACTAISNEPVQPKITYENRNIGVEIFPNPAKPKVEGKGITDKYLEYMEWFGKHWRLCQLAIPRLHNKKFVRPEEKDTYRKILPKLADHVAFFTEQMSSPTVRYLTMNKLNHQSHMGKKWSKKMRKTINKSWGTIYNYYEKKKRDMRKYKLKRLSQGKKKKMSGKDLKSKEEFYSNLAKRKEPPKPPPKEKKPKREPNLERLGEMAVPKERIYTPPTIKPVSKAALKYNATERLLVISRPPPRYFKILPPLIPGKVKKSALKYVATPSFLKMTEPIVRHCGGKPIVTQTETDNQDCFTVKPSALKYKITARIKKLAEPKERQ